MSIVKAAVEEYLSVRPHRTGETIQFGWFIFRIAEQGNSPRVESLDFRQMASFTEDFSEVERIYALQRAALTESGAEECLCTFQQSALVSLSYSPGRADAFLKRMSPSKGSDSGWYVGVHDECRSLEDPSSLTRRSLYELTIYDMRMAAYWLLPEGAFISLDKSA